jgi:hypothetical protein
VGDCTGKALAFGYVDNNVVSCANMYACRGVVDWRWDETGDWAVVRVDRVVQGVTPLIVNYSGTVPATAELMTIGYPFGLAEMVAGNGMVHSLPSSGSGFFTTTLDAFMGNSGSPVINVATGVVEGIHSGNAFPSQAPSIPAHYVAVPDGDGGLCAIERYCSESTGCQIPGGGTAWSNATVTAPAAALSKLPLHTALVMAAIH